MMFTYDLVTPDIRGAVSFRGTLGAAAEAARRYGVAVEVRAGEYRERGVLRTDRPLIGIVDADGLYWRDSDQRRRAAAAQLQRALTRR